LMGKKKKKKKKTIGGAAGEPRGKGAAVVEKSQRYKEPQTTRFPRGAYATQH